MQPTYLPWSGYFNLIASVDCFYYLDDVQYERGSWHHRNRIWLGENPQWLTVPVMRKFLGQQLYEVLLDPKQINWRRKHSDTIRHAYGRCPYVQDLSSIIEIIEYGSQTTLAEINIDLIEKICVMLDIDTVRYRSSKYSVELPRSQKLIELCRLATCDEYLSPLGAKEYLTSDNFEQLSEICLSFQNFQPTYYPQYKVTEFISHLSILDVIANLGIQGTKDYIR